VGKAARGGDPPKSSIAAVWSVEGFGKAKDRREKCADPFWGHHSCTRELGDNESKLAPIAPAKTVTKKSPVPTEKARMGRVPATSRKMMRRTARKMARPEKSPRSHLLKPLKNRHRKGKGDNRWPIPTAAVAEKPKVNGAAEAGSAPVTFLEAIKQAMFEEMERRTPQWCCWARRGGIRRAFKTSEGLLQRFGWERVIDTPISESAIIGAACGMSYLGLRPIAEMQFIDFIACCFNQLTNFVAKGHYLWNAPAPIVVRGPSGRRRAWRPFHSANPEMYFVHTPG